MSDDTRDLMDNIAKLSAEVPAEEWKALARARMREKMEKDPEATAALVDDLLAAGRAQGELDRKTDAEVADLVSKLEGILELPALSPISTLIENAAERLRRADGGPTYTAEDHIEAERAREAEEAKKK
jgi:hypothetical protein